MVMPLDLKQTAIGAWQRWQRAKQDIYDSWTVETDPANLQPRVSRFNRQLAAFLRENPPSGVEQLQLERCLDAIESPCPRRDEMALREVFQREHESNDAKARDIVGEVERLGLEPFQAPQPLPPIRPEDVHLICWLAIESLLI
jgi:hypothetical protein